MIGIVTWDGEKFLDNTEEFTQIVNNANTKQYSKPL